MPQRVTELHNIMPLANIPLVLQHGILSHEEAAIALGIPVGTVKTHILRGKAKLRARLAAKEKP